MKAKKKTKRVSRLLEHPLEQKASIAFICSFCLGDSLISMVTVHNLIRNGYNVTVFGDYVCALREWFPYCTIKPLVKIADQKILQEFDVVLHMYEGELSLQMSQWHPRSITLSDSMLYLADLTMTDIQVTLCQKEFGLKDAERINHIQPLQELSHRIHGKRIVIHPTSSLKRKDWPAHKFLKLSKQLYHEGFEINFIVSPSERPHWEHLQYDYVKIPTFSSLSDVAKFIYESGYFIGNDSGIGHLASNLGIPTVSIILRKGVAKQWRPTWAPGKVVLSPSWLNPRPIKEKLWKVFTSVKRVRNAFNELINEQM